MLYARSRTANSPSRLLASCKPDWHIITAPFPYVFDYSRACKHMMLSWHVLSPLLLSLGFRQVLERRAALALAENILLLALTQWVELSQGIILVILVIFVTLAFWQTQFEYFESVQGPYSRAAKSWNSGCPVNTICHQAKFFNYRTPQEAQVPKCNDNTQIEKAFHGRVMMFPCDLQHLRRSGFKDDYHHSYLYVGYPVGFHACYKPLVTVEPHIRLGSLLPIKKTWFSIRPEDHAFNGGAHLSMTQKLEEFLVSEVRFCHKLIGTMG